MLSWDHAWFAHHDPGDDLNVFLWTELEDGIDDAFDPTTPYVNPLISRYAPFRGKASKAKFSGTMFFALDAELRKGGSLKWDRISRTASGSVMIAC